MEENEKLVETAGADANASAAPAAVADAATTTKQEKGAAAADATATANTNSETGTHQEHIQEALALLCKHFPKAFVKDGECKPLKVGILEDLKPLIANIEGLSISKVRAAVRVYTTRLRYFYAVREGAMRVDVQGNEVEPVTAEHAEYARARFTEINAKRRPPKPKKPAKQGGFKGKRPFNRDGQGQGQQGGGNGAAGGNGKRPFNRGDRNGQGQGQGQGQGKGQGGNRRFGGNQQRRLEPAKESDIRVGRYVLVSSDRSYLKGTIAEEMRGDSVKVTLQNGSSLMTPLNRIFLSFANNNRPKRNFDRRGPRNGGDRGDRGNRNQGGRPHGGAQKGGASAGADHIKNGE